jgi:endonuclease III-like uncharacterized protein
MPSDLPRFTIRISRSLLEKIGYISEENGRSVNKEVEQLIKKHITDYERTHGAIKIKGF